MVWAPALYVDLTHRTLGLCQRVAHRLDDAPPTTEMVRMVYDAGTDQARTPGTSPCWCAQAAAAVRDPTPSLR
jgi:hypothetical protein